MFIAEIDKLILDLDRHYELCTIEYVSYAVERLKLAISGVAHLKNHLEMNRLAVHMQDRHMHVVDSYVGDLKELLISLRPLSQKWHTHEETIEQQSELLAYRVFNCVTRAYRK